MILRNTKNFTKNINFKNIISRYFCQKTTDDNNLNESNISKHLLDNPPEKPADPQFPSDYEEYRMQEWLKYNKIKRSQEKKVKRPLIDPRDTSIILFPGQGAQYVGKVSSIFFIR